MTARPPTRRRRGLPPVTEVDTLHSRQRFLRDRHHGQERRNGATSTALASCTTPPTACFGLRHRARSRRAQQNVSEHRRLHAETRSATHRRRIEEFVPITVAIAREQNSDPPVWGDLNGAKPLTPAIAAAAPPWTTARRSSDPVPPSTPGNRHRTFSIETEIVDTIPAGGFSFNSSPGNPVGGTVATITDPNTSAAASAYSATINWGDGNSSAGTIGGRQRQLHGDGKPHVRRARDIPGRGHDHVGRRQPGELDRDRLGDRRATAAPVSPASARRPVRPPAEPASRSPGTTSLARRRSSSDRTGLPTSTWSTPARSRRPRRRRREPSM